MKQNQHNNIRPHYLKQNDTIGLVAPASALPSGVLEKAVSLFQSWGLNVVKGSHIENNKGSYSASDKERARDVQQFVDNPNIKAIISLRGGYGSIRIVEYIDFIGMIKNPKWLVGFSDITVLHSILNSRMGLESLHATMPIDFIDTENESTLSLKEALFGQLTNYSIAPNHFNIEGKASGKLIGGNLSILQSIAGTFCDINPENNVLFIEDIGEPAYNIDRMMMNLVCSGKLSQISALIVGSFTNIKGEKEFGKTAYDIICEHVSKFNIPAIFGFPAGHSEINKAMYFGREIEIQVEKDKVTVSYTI